MDRLLKTAEETWDNFRRGFSEWLTYLAACARPAKDQSDVDFLETMSKLSQRTADRLAQDDK